MPAADLPVVAAADEPEDVASLESDVWEGCEDVAAADACEESGVCLFSCAVIVGDLAQGLPVLLLSSCLRTSRLSSPGNDGGHGQADVRVLQR